MKLGGYLGLKREMSKPLLNGASGPVDSTEEDAASMHMIASIASIHDHIASCAKNLQTETSFAAVDIKEERFSCDFDHMYATHLTEHDDATEIRQLKGLLLLHLDLIQQQSEQILNKDKELHVLKQENDMLRQRLERMDRRVTLNHSKKSPTDPLAPGGLPPPTPGSPNAASEQSTELPPVNEEETLIQPKCEVSVSPPPTSPLNLGTRHLPLPEQRPSRSRKSSFSSDSGTPRRSLGSDRGTENSTRDLDNITRAESVVRSTDGSNRNSDSFTRSLDNNSLSAENSVQGVENITQGAESNIRPRTASPVVNLLPPKRLRLGPNQRQINEAEEVPADSPRSINTPVLYYVPGETFDGWGCKKSPSGEEDPTPQRLLEVPRWRIKPCTSCYSMEGTENLEDEVFLKRHQRLEQDERRRKRWDIQRLREQRQYERLKQRQTQMQVIASTPGRGKGGTRRRQHNDPPRLWPDPEEVEFIDLNNVVPVSAFGTSMPAFPPTQFELPWTPVARTHQRPPGPSAPPGNRKSHKSSWEPRRTSNRRR